MTTASTDLARRARTASPLDADQLATLRAVLRESMAKYQRDVERPDASAGDDDVGRDRALAHIAADAIADIADALARIDEGTYGICEACGCPIPFERLEVIPHARFCVGCPRRGGLVR